jgi:hypothetical protein
LARYRRLHGGEDEIAVDNELSDLEAGRRVIPETSATHAETTNPPEDDAASSILLREVDPEPEQL